MKRFFLMIGCCLLTASLTAQEKRIQNVQFELMEGYASSRAFLRHTLAIPNLPGYTTIKCDLHLHTHYSDGQVTPLMRVHEAYVEGLDAISLTDHQPTPRSKSETEDCNIAYKKAKSLADSKGIMLIKGLEITGKEPTGHLNVHFIKDCNDYMPADKQLTDEVIEAYIEKAAAEGAYITTNHPGWPDRNSELCPLIIRQIEKKNIRGIEIFNNEEFYPLAIDHANKYNLSHIAATDAHYPVAFTFDLKDNHRPMTLVFAKEKTEEAMKEALLAGRTIAWADNLLTGNKTLLKEFLRASLKVTSYKIEGQRMFAQVQNDTDIPYLLDNGIYEERIRIPARGTCTISRNVQNLNILYKVRNMYCSSTDCLEIPLSYLFLKSSEEEFPYINERTVKYTEKGILVELVSEEGKDVHYTLDGSEPTQASPRYTTPLLLGESTILKACYYKDGKRSQIYDRKVNFSKGVKAKAKPGIAYRYYEGKFSTPADIDKKGELKKTGEVEKISTNTMGQPDYYGFIYDGLIYAPESGLYVMSLVANDAASMSIAGNLVVEIPDGDTNAFGKVYLQKGYHPVSVRYYEGYGSELLTLKWTLPSGRSEEIPATNFFIK